MNKRRNQEINFLKFIAVICIILIHDKLPGNAGAVIRGIAAMAVPVFFMISGYYSYNVSTEVLGKRAKRIFFLMLIANAIYFVWDICVELLSGNSLQIWFGENCSVKRVLVWFLTNESSLRGHLWFLGALLYAYLFLFFIMKVYEQRKMSELLLKKDMWLAVLAGILLCGNIIGGEILTQLGKNIQIPYIRNWLFCGIPFLLTGYCLHGYTLRRKKQCSTFQLSIMLLGAIMLNIVEVILVESCELYFTTIFVVIFSFMLALQMEGKSKNRVIKLLGNIADKYGLWIYILQIMVIKTIQWSEEIFGWTDNVIVQWTSPIASFLVTGMLAILPVWLSDFNKRYK